VSQKVFHLVILEVNLLCQPYFPLCQCFGDYRFSEIIDNLTKGLHEISFELEKRPKIPPIRPQVRYDLGLRKSVQEAIRGVFEKRRRVVVFCAWWIRNTRGKGTDVPSEKKFTGRIKSETAN